MTPAPAPMTAGEAADLLVKNIDAQPAAIYRDVVRGFMTANWPAGGAVTFDVEAVAREIAQEWWLKGTAFTKQTLHSDVRDEIKSLATDVLRRHAAAPATAQVVEVTGEDVKVYGLGELDYDRTLWDVYNDVDALGSIAESLNHALRVRAARAGTAGQTTGAQIDKHAVGLYEKFSVRRTDGSSGIGQKHHGCRYFVLDLTHDIHAPKALRGYIESCAADYPVLAADLEKWAEPATTGAQWVYRPVGQASALVVPEDGVYAFRNPRFDPADRDNPFSVFRNRCHKGMRVEDLRIDAIRRIDTDAPTTWIEKTPATAGGWTAGDVEACVGQWYVIVNEFNERETWCGLRDNAENIAAGFNQNNVAAFIILPPVEAAP